MEYLIKKINNLSEKDFIEVYKKCSERFKSIKTKQLNNLKLGDRVIIYPIEGDTIKGSVIEIYAYGFRINSDNGFSIAISGGVKFKKESEVSNKNIRKLKRSDGEYSVKVVSDSGSTAKVKFEDGTIKTVMKNKLGI